MRSIVASVRQNFLPEEPWLLRQRCLGFGLKRLCLLWRSSRHLSGFGLLRLGRSALGLSARLAAAVCLNDAPSYVMQLLLLHDQVRWLLGAERQP